MKFITVQKKIPAKQHNTIKVHAIQSKTAKIHAILNNSTNTSNATIYNLTICNSAQQNYIQCITIQQNYMQYNRNSAIQQKIYNTAHYNINAGNAVQHYINIYNEA